MQELIKVNNNLSLLMKKKRALQDFIKAEEDRLEGIDPRERAYKLKYDDDFIKKNNRPRKPQEIAHIMKYSKRQVERFLEIKKEGM